MGSTSSISGSSRGGAGRRGAGVGSAAGDRTDTTVDAARMGFAVARLTRRLRQEAAGGVPASQLGALATVAREGPMTLGALADAERLAPPTVTRIAAKLEEAGYLRRLADPSDRRVALVSATPAGEALLAEVRRRRAAWLEDRLAHLGARDRARLHAALDALERLADAP